MNNNSELFKMNEEMLEPSIMWMAEQVLINILSNAIKFTEAPGEHNPYGVAHREL